MSSCLKSIFLSFSVLALGLTGCSGGSGGPGSGVGAAPAAAKMVTGVAATGAPMVGTVYLVDSAQYPATLKTSTASDGSFSFNATGLSAPFLIKASGGGSNLYSVATDFGITNVTPLTSMVLAQATAGADLDTLFNKHVPGDIKAAADRLPAAVAAVKSTLAPLMKQYNVGSMDILNAQFSANHTGLDAMLDSISVSIADGKVTIASRVDNSVMFTAPSGNIAAGGAMSMTSSASPPSSPPMTGDPSSPPASSSGSALYASKCAGCHGDIANSSLKGMAAVGTIQAAIDSGRGGMGMLSGMSAADMQAISDVLMASSSSTGTSTPPAATPSTGTTSDGPALYAANCAGCHGTLTKSRKIGITVVRLQNAISGDVGGMGFLTNLTAADYQAIVTALNPPASTPAPIPAPSPAPDGATLYAADCAGCHGPLATSNKLGITLARLQGSFSTVPAMSSLSSMGSAYQQAIVSALNSTTPTPVPVPTPSPSPSPVPDGSAMYASDCAGCHGPLASSSKMGMTIDRLKSAIVNVSVMQFLSTLTDVMQQALVAVLNPSAPVPAPTPSPAPTPAPVPVPTPSPAPALDGAALYAANCAGCHGALANSSKQGVTIARLQSAIGNGIGGMGFLSTLSADQQQAIVTALAPSTPAPAPAPAPAPTPSPAPDGAELYATNCAGCHGALATSNKQGITIAQLQTAIAGNTGGMGPLSRLTVTEVQAIVTALTPATPTPTPTPTPAPTLDGAALYATNCAGCHGALATSSKTGVTLARLQNAVSSNTGGMGFLSTLSADQQQAIVTALAPAPVPTPAPTPVPTPTPADGATLYGANCAGCHGALASSGKAGATVARIQTAITNNTGGMGYLSSLTSTQLTAIATALAGVTPSPTPAPAPACGSCHAIPPATGRHSKHLSKGISCAVCHGSGYGTTTVNAATHNNGVKNVASTTGWNATARSCANSCHGTERW